MSCARAELTKVSEQTGDAGESEGAGAVARGGVCEEKDACDYCGGA